MSLIQNNKNSNKRRELLKETYNIFLIGKQGLLGKALVECLSKNNNFEIHASSHQDLDICDENHLEQALESHSYHFVINASGFVNVNKCEEFPEKAFNINTKGVEFLAKQCHKRQIPLLHFSTDYLFDGRSERPYEENDPPNPINVYGLSKLRGEEALRYHCSKHIILRTSWLFGPNGKSFIKTMLSLAMTKEEIEVVNDQFGNPTFVEDLAQCSEKIIEGILIMKKYFFWGTYHYTGQPTTSWYDFAKFIFMHETYPFQQKPLVKPIGAEEFYKKNPLSAPRPLFSALDCHKIQEVFNVKPLPWMSRIKDLTKYVP